MGQSENCSFIAGNYESCIFQESFKYPEADFLSSARDTALHTGQMACEDVARSGTLGKMQFPTTNHEVHEFQHKK